MSYCYDTMSRAWAKLRAKLPEETQGSEVAMRFEFLIEEMHEANHRLRDAVNHDAAVSNCASRLDKAMTEESQS